MSDHWLEDLTNWALALNTQKAQGKQVSSSGTKPFCSIGGPVIRATVGWGSCPRQMSADPDASVFRGCPPMVLCAEIVRAKFAQHSDSGHRGL